MISFLTQFLKEPRQTGAILPTANTLSDLITDLADLKKAQMIVELGPGTGAFTERILLKKKAETKFLALEINPVFVESLRRKYPTLSVIEDSAEKLDKYLDQLGVIKCDRIVSGLPWASFKLNDQTKILNSITQNLEVTGLFLTFAYIHATFLPSGRRFKMELQKRFSKVEISKIIWSNFPPAFVYIARGVKNT